MFQSPFNIFSDALSVMKVNDNLSCADWADKYFFLSAESSNTSGPWKTTTVQRAILNAMGNDAIEKVDFFKSARFGGTKMLVIAGAYGISHKNRNTGFYQPTKTDSDDFVKGEIEPALRDCEPWNDLLVSKSEKSDKNTLSYKAFKGANAYFRGGHSANSYRRLTLDSVFLDELDGFRADISKEGNPTTLSWGRIKNSTFKKQVQISTPLISEHSLIEASSKSAEDIVDFHAKCPNCHDHTPIEWGGKDVPYGFKWEGRDASTVLHYCKLCGTGWGNSELIQACDLGYWQGSKYKTYDGMEWFKKADEDEDDEDKENSNTPSGFLPCPPPRHIAFRAWSAYSPFSPWSQIVEEWYDAQGDIGKLQAFTNTTLGRTWNLQHAGTLTKETIEGIIPTDDLSDVIAITAGVDIQDDRIEIQYVGHTYKNDIIVLDYEILKGTMSEPEVFAEMGRNIYNYKIDTGKRVLKVINACIDTQGHHTTSVHKFLLANRRSRVFVGINGTANSTYEIADKSGTYKGVKNSVYYSIGVNVIKQKVFTAVRSFDNDKGAFKIWAEAALPDDYATQLTVEKMEIKKVGGLDKVTFTNKNKLRNEALDTLVYALAAKAYIKKHRGRQGKLLFSD